MTGGRSTRCERLIADDSRVNQTVAQRLVERCGYRPEVVADGHQAVEAVERTRSLRPEPVLAPVAAGAGRILDPNALRELRSLPQQAFAELVSLYTDEAATQISELRRAYAEGDTLRVARTAHKLKGASLAVGAILLSGAARQLETRAKAATLGREDAELIGQLEAALRETTSAYQVELGIPVA